MRPSAADGVADVVTEPAIDLVHLAAFLDGTLSQADHEATLQLLAQSPDALEILADATLPRVNPFQPTGTVSVATFSGREHEKKALANALAQTKAGTPTNFMLVGERGFGKSSFLSYAAALAEGSVGRLFRFVVLDTYIDPPTTQGSLFAAIANSLRRKISAEWGGAENIERELTGIAEASITRNAEKPLAEAVAIDRVAYAIAESVTLVTTTPSSRTGSTADGILWLIDEADNAVPELRLGAVLRQLLERLASLRCNRFMIGVAGLPSLPTALTASHKSAARPFKIIPLGRMSPQEAGALVAAGIAAGARKNDHPITVTNDAISAIVDLADGVPHLLQQIAHCAFEEDTDWHLDKNDVDEGLNGPAGALTSIAVANGWTEVVRAASTDARWAILRFLAQSHAGRATRKAIHDLGLASEAEIEARISQLVQNGMIEDAPGGHVALSSRFFRRWIEREIAIEAESHQSIASTAAIGRSSKPSPLSISPRRSQVFISYSSHDDVWRARLEVHLRPLTRGGVTVWSDKTIQPGVKWRDAISEALRVAKVAILLVTPDFLASDFIADHELPPLLEAARADGLTILWVPVRASLFKETIINDFHAAIPSSRPLAMMPDAEVDEALVKVCETVKATLGSK